MSGFQISVFAIGKVASAADYFAPTKEQKDEIVRNEKAKKQVREIRVNGRRVYSK